MCILVMLLLLSWMILMIFYRDGTTTLAKLIMLHVRLVESKIKYFISLTVVVCLGANSGP